MLVPTAANMLGKKAYLYFQITTYITGEQWEVTNTVQARYRNFIPTAIRTYFFFYPTKKTFAFCLCHIYGLGSGMKLWSGEARVKENNGHSSSQLCTRVKTTPL